ncbi:MAG: PotD/PotF family extracellular solute-binding protein [Proteobacteria bacterium]|nr:PotD/PotF family extracellular solute-binding protein [Pseudomonadota bacterium]
MIKLSESGRLTRSLLQSEEIAALTRRGFCKGLVAVAGLGAVGLAAKPAHAAATINWMGWEEYGYPLRAGGYIEANDITLEGTFASSIESILTKLRGGGIGTMNIGMPTWNYVSLFQESGVLQEMDVSRIPNFKKLHSYWQNFEGNLYKGTQYSVPYLWGGLPLIYRKDMPLPVPQNWADLEKPEYKDQFCMIHDTTSTMWHWVYTVTGVPQASRITPKQLDDVIDYMIKIKKEHARMLAMSYGEGLDAVVRGEVQICAQGWEPMASWAKDMGADLDWTYPSEGSYGWMDTIILAKDAPYIDETYGLINHALDVEPQTVVGDVIFCGAVNPAAVPLMAPESRAMYRYDDIEAFYQNAPLIPLPPFEDDGKHATYDQWLEGYERFLKA